MRDNILTNINLINRVYLQLNNMSFRHKKKSSFMEVYTTPTNPNIVLKIIPSAKHFADRYASNHMGKHIGQQPWAPVKGDDIASAQRIIDKNNKSFLRAQQHLNGLVAPFIILNGKELNVPSGSFKLYESDGTEIERNFKGTIALVQQKIQAFIEFVPAFVEAGKNKNLEKIFQGLTELVLSIWKRGLFYRCLKFHNDYGINQDEKILVLDIDGFTCNQRKGIDYVKKREMFNVYSFEWLQSKYPGLATFYRKVVDHDLTVKNLKRVWGTEANRPENQVVFDEKLLLPTP